MDYKETKSRDVIDLFEILFSEYGWSYDEVMSIPIPAFIETVGALKRRKENELKISRNAMKGKKGIKHGDGNV